MVYLPFSISISPMQKLLLINFEKDPDEIYHGLEPQWFDDPAFGRGLRVIAWRKDGYVDVYQQPELPKEDDFNVASKGLADLIVHPMPGAYLENTLYVDEVEVLTTEDKEQVCAAGVPERQCL